MSRRVPFAAAVSMAAAVGVTEPAPTASGDIPTLAATELVVDVNGVRGR